MKPYLFAAALSALTVQAVALDARADWPSTGWGKLNVLRIDLVGRDLNGVDLNGDALDGRFVESVELGDVTLSNGPMREVSLDETRFGGRDARGKKAKQDDFVGAWFEANLDDGSTIPLQVTDIRRHPSMVHKDVWGYELWYPRAGDWAPLCGVDDDGQPLLAIPLAGRWNHEQGVPGGGDWIDDPTKFTFACDGYVISKCVFGGYKPWGKVRGVKLAAHHQACTRALRADYWGDGTPHTHDGMLINYYDKLGIRDDVDAWSVEAEWTESGALCANQSRIGEVCVDSITLEECGSFENGALLVTELAPEA